MAAPNIVNVTSIYGQSNTVPSITNSGSDIILTCATDKVLKVNSLIIANIDGTNNCDVDAWFDKGGAGAQTGYFAHTISVPADSTLVVISKDTAVYMEETDEIHLLASAAGDLSAIISWEELDDA